MTQFKIGDEVKFKGPYASMRLGVIAKISEIPNEFGMTVCWIDQARYGQKPDLRGPYAMSEIELYYGAPLGHGA